jgi:hypothetical protein
MGGRERQDAGGAYGSTLALGNLQQLTKAHTQ